MCQKQIKLNAKEDVQEFVKAAGKCDFDIDVFYNRIIIDAKSILGVLSMDLTQVLTVPVSYTHLDVYKRQVLQGEEVFMLGFLFWSVWKRERQSHLLWISDSLKSCFMQKIIP